VAPTGGMFPLSAPTDFCGEWNETASENTAAAEG
jgi:hypothetical protein